MKQRYKKSKSYSETDSRAYKILTTTEPNYWDEMVSFHNRSTKGKDITHKQYRAYRSWKYNRKTKFKPTI